MQQRNHKATTACNSQLYFFLMSSVIAKFSLSTVKQHADQFRIQWNKRELTTKQKCPSGSFSKANQKEELYLFETKANNNNTYEKAEI